MAGYPMGTQPFPGQQQQQVPGGYAYGQPQQQQQQPQQQQQQYGGQQQPAVYGQQQHYQGMRHGNPPPNNSQHYGDYGSQTHENVYAVNAWQAMQFSSQNDFFVIFESKKSQRFNAIQAEELMYILNNTGQIRDFYKISWSLELCKIMIAMLDRSSDGMMQYEEFCELLQCLVFWHQTFQQYDTNRSGFMEACELHRCIKERMKYNVSAKAMQTLLKRYSRAMDDGRLLVAFDDFVSCLVRMRAYTEAFRARDRSINQGHETGNASFGYDDFLQCVMCL